MQNIQIQALLPIRAASPIPLMFTDTFYLYADKEGLDSSHHCAQIPSKTPCRLAWLKVVATLKYAPRHAKPYLRAYGEGQHRPSSLNTIDCFNEEQMPG